MEKIIKDCFLSIIIPIYKNAEYLDEAIKSCIEPDIQIEIILVEDGYSDITRKAIKAILQNNYYKNISIKAIYLEKNIGTFLARKKGVQSATGKYITFLDADDYFINNAMSVFYAKLVELENKDTRYDAILFQYQRNNVLVPKFPAESSSINQQNLTFITYLNKYYNQFIWSSAGKIYHKDILLQVYKDLDVVTDHLVLAEDLLVYTIAAKYIKNFYILNQSLYFYRVHSQSIMEKITKGRKVFVINQLNKIEYYLLQETPKNKEYEIILRKAKFRLSIEKLYCKCGFKRSVFYYIGYIYFMLRHFSVAYVFTIFYQMLLLKLSINNN
ncbi:glycosyltransferase family 2 protein [Gallibacterium trehalosifermentans]|uniref:Glycosyltransferase family 2 protein n=1 Tax=Gallibacterium trehalosifermentans TaxID=516935 RepID=A0ABV6GYJ6_9PAST